jgi:hypothetical protein
MFGGTAMTVLSDVTWYDPAWIAVYVAILAILVAVVSTIVVYRKQQSRKEISFGVVSANSLLSVSKEVKSKVQVLYDGNSVSNVRLIKLKIWNSGNQPIEKEDFDNNSIKFDFGPSSEILDIEIKDPVPKNLKITPPKNNKDNFLLEPFLLNKRESLTIKVLLSSTIEQIIVDTRIRGTEQVTESREYTDVIKVLEDFAELATTGSMPFRNPIVGKVSELLFRRLIITPLSNQWKKRQNATIIKDYLSLDIKDWSIKN